MRLDRVMDEVASALEEITGLRVQAHPPSTISAPGGYVSYPATIRFDETYGRGCDIFDDLPIVLLAGKAVDRAARDTVAAWASGAGPLSLKRVMEARQWQACDDLTVTSCEFDVETVASVPYLAAMFKATVIGPGED